MQDKPVALVMVANQGSGLRIASNLAAHGSTVTDPSSFADMRTVEQGARQGARPDVRPALLDASGPTGTLSDEDGPVAW